MVKGKRNISIPVICLLGATGTGKSALALTLAEEFNGVIINIDSRQVYTDFPIITAQPDTHSLKICEHKLYGFLSSNEKLSAGRYVILAEQAIADSFSKGKIPFLVGGTGLYADALLKGIAAIPSIKEDVSVFWQEAFKQKGSVELYKQLEIYDSDYAALIHPNDSQRITRALEVFFSTNKPFSWWHAQPFEPCPYLSLKLGIDTNLTDLTPVLVKRIQKMLGFGEIEFKKEDILNFKAKLVKQKNKSVKNTIVIQNLSKHLDIEELKIIEQLKLIEDIGALAEVKSAILKEPNINAVVWSGIGCLELRAYLEGKIGLDEACELWLNHTRQYAKRQNTWFKKDKEINWIKKDDFDLAKQYVQDFLTTFSFRPSKSNASCELKS